MLGKIHKYAYEEWKNVCEVRFINIFNNQKYINLYNFRTEFSDMDFEDFAILVERQ